MGKKRFAAFPPLEARARTLDMSLDAQGSVLVSRSRKRQCTSSGTRYLARLLAFLSLWLHGGEMSLKKRRNLELLVDLAAPEIVDWQPGSARGDEEDGNNL
jgi:hypothetical protein